MTVQILKGDCRNVLKTLPDQSVHCVVTSPPYWGLRDYGVSPGIWGGLENCNHQWDESRYYTEKSAAKSNGCAEAFSAPGPGNAQRLKDARWRQEAVCSACGAWRGSFGLERAYPSYVEHSIEIFREVRRVLRPDGSLWLNIGDSFHSGNRGGYDRERAGVSKNGGQNASDFMAAPNRLPQPGLKDKDLCGIPWRVALALQADGWYLRMDNIWAKPNPMPESVTDRPTRSHEYLFLLTKSSRYYYDGAAIAEPLDRPEEAERKTPAKFGGADKHVEAGKQSRLHSGNEYHGTPTGTRNKRSVWTIGTQPFADAHFAVFPPSLIEPCILAGCPKDGTVLDPFGGAGTTGLVADRLGRNAILIELNPEYADMAKRRIEGDAGMFANVT